MLKNFTTICYKMDLLIGIFLSYTITLAFVSIAWYSYGLKSPNKHKDSKVQLLTFPYW